MTALVIEPRFCGPPGMGNGGYVAGRLAEHVDGAAEVTLRRPVPIGRALEVERRADGAVELRDGAEMLAEARPATLDLVPPAPPSAAAAAAASRDYVGFRRRVVSACFVCGPERAPDDGLRIFVGPLGADGAVAAPWHPDATLGGADGAVDPAFGWAALDCPGAFAFGGGDETSPLLLGRLTGAVTGRIAVGERCIVLGWPIARDGRKLIAGTAVFGAAAELRGLARAVWFAPPGRAG
jgi:hypothetical protein